MNLNDALRECALDLLATEDRVEIDHLVDCAEQRYPDAFVDETARLVRNAARNTAKKLLRDLAEDDDGDQLRLPGLILPTALAVPAENGDGYYYVRTDKATWPQVEAGRHIREVNVERAQAKLDAYDDSMGKLSPLMAHDWSLTVGDALREMNQ